MNKSRRGREVPAMKKLESKKRWEGERRVTGNV